ncbi:MAG: hypothetical protein K2G70_00330 [Turicibacter sp.]|nr:hypothetical protein [Turicibacter sp.]
MNCSLLFLLSLLPSFLTGTHEITQDLTIPVDVYEDLASLNDIVTTLDGNVQFDEETGTYTYHILDQEIQLNLEYGYSQVNDEKEALFVEKDEETNLTIIKWRTPQLIDDEIYVPIQYIERVFDATYTDQAFAFHAIKIDVEEELKAENEEEFISDSIAEVEEETTTNRGQVPNYLGQINQPSQVEQAPTQPTQTPPQVEQAPTRPTQTPPQVEQAPTQPTQTPPQVEQPDEENQTEYNKPGQLPSEPEVTPDTPEEPNVPEENPVTPEEPNAPEENPVTPETPSPEDEETSPIDVENEITM